MASSAALINDELVRWHRRQEQIEEVLKRLSDEEERLSRELSKAERQLAYYSSLASDMKREYEPPGLASMLKSFRRA